ncbi:hypothetical protein JCM24511_01543 [Saitozyma sp. JCM 24511]|nr:hypothetical protein JCM24511_01543 [Saitozyma sp. JCM 24511]
MQQQRPADTGSRTLTISRSATPDLARAGTAPTTASESEAVESPPVGVLRLRGGPTRRRVVWRDDTVDNEGMGKKKSKNADTLCATYPSMRVELSKEDTADQRVDRVGRTGWGWVVLRQLTPAVCCIYHRPRAFDESSTESSSGSDDDDDDIGDGDSRQPNAGPSESGRNAKAQRGIMKRREGGGEVEQSSESDSEGGQGDGRARHGHKHAAKPNRYDHQEKHGTPGQAMKP